MEAPLSLTEGDNAADDDQMETAPSGSKRGAADGEQRDDDKVMNERRKEGRTMKKRAVPENKFSFTLNAAV